MIVIALQLKLWFALIAKSIVVYLFIQLLFVTVNLSSVLKLPFFGCPFWVGWVVGREEFLLGCLAFFDKYNEHPLLKI